ncbi:MAG TPA: 6-phosphogluconolactonase [Acidimicrobiales bacterium]
MRHDVTEISDVTELARAGATLIAERARHAVEERGHFTMAVSGGHNPWTMFRDLASCDMPWEQTVFFQVDERVAPRGDEDRNLTHLMESFSDVRATVVAMRVEDDDLDAAAADYQSRLPERFDLIHLGLGPDGHTASLVADDPVLDVTDRLVAVTRPYQGRQRMTLTYPALALCDQILWLITGESARTPLTALLAGDDTIPAGRVTAPHSLVMTDLSIK